jgi:cell division FtsZ-interacting protein ZapD
MSSQTAVLRTDDRSAAWLALVLALLSIPGATLAWDLPAGGFWIGVPLSIAAIVIGLRAQREARGRTIATVAIVVAGLTFALTAVWTLVSVVS